MTPEAMAALHAKAFAGQGRAWSAAEFADLIAAPHVFCVASEQAFALGRAVAGEAELLTLATHPAHQRRGLARACLAQIEAEARARKALRLFLEVAADNAPAIGLYRSAGYLETARRVDYYERAAGARVDALLLEKPLA